MTGCAVWRNRFARGLDEPAAGPQNSTRDRLRAKLQARQGAHCHPDSNLPDTGLLIPAAGPPRVFSVKTAKGAFDAGGALGEPPENHCILRAVHQGEDHPLCAFWTSKEGRPPSHLAAQIVANLRPQGETHEDIRGDVLLVDDGRPLEVEHLDIFLRPDAAAPPISDGQLRAFAEFRAKHPGVQVVCVS